MPSRLVNDLDLYNDNNKAQYRTPGPNSRKRTFDSASDRVASPGSTTQAITDGQRMQHFNPNRTRHLHKIQNGELIFPKSSYDGWHPTYPVLNEKDIIDRIPAASSTGAPQASYLTIDLFDFSIYRSPRALKRSGELTMLNALNVEAGVDDLYFDGYVTVDNQRCFLKEIKFNVMAIEGYGLDTGYDSVKNDVSIQTAQSARASVWYKLCKPAQEYNRYHDIFLWIADLAKYVIDFMSESEVPIGLHHFRQEYMSWSQRAYGHSPVYRQWSSLIRGNDFRSAVSAHIHYIWKEVFSVDQTLCDHPLWKETNTLQLGAIPIYTSGNKSGMTIVTPFVHKIFKDRYFASILQAQSHSPTVAILTEQRRRTLGLTPPSSFKTVAPTVDLSRTSSFSVGDVVAIRPDAETPWKNAQTVWYAYIQGIQYRKYDQHKLDLIWLYSPCDTVIGKSPYPFSNELFLSDNCSCGQDAYDSRLVVGKIDVQWGIIDPVQAQENNSWIVRRTYYSHTDEFVTLQQSHFRCNCGEPAISDFDQVCREFSRGDFVLVRGRHSEDRTKDDPILRPAQVLQILHADKRILLRRLTAVSLRSNEVIWSDDTFVVRAKLIVRKCTVEGFSSMASVTGLFHRGGAGDLFYYVYHGIDPNPYPTNGTLDRKDFPGAPKLSGMGICCGGGNFDRGLEDSGGITFEHAIDIDQRALHTYRANTEDPSTVDLFLGPMEDYLYDAISETMPSHNRAAIGTVDLIAAGCPCQAFSTMQTNKVSKTSIKRASLVACVMAYVEHYMPSYFVLENVLGIAGNIKGMSTNQNILSRMICFLVSLGYQTQQFVMDASAHHGSQSRRRVFVVATAPDLDPPDRPPQSSHRADGDVFRSFSLGKLSNGVRIGGAQDELAPFPMISFDANTKDLPDIGDGHVEACIAFPDHRMGCRQGLRFRNIVTMIPRLPRGMGFAQAARMGKLSQHVLQSWPERVEGKAYTRLHPGKVMSVITTVLRPHDAYAGKTLHPDQHRVLTVMEARRGQGIPDHEVILGSPQEQWKIIGNSVHRNVAFALGCSITSAWQKSQSKPLFQVLQDRTYEATETKNGSNNERPRDKTSDEQTSSTMPISLPLVTNKMAILTERVTTTTFVTVTPTAVQEGVTKRKMEDASIQENDRRRKWPRWRA